MARKFAPALALFTALILSWIGCSAHENAPATVNVMGSSALASSANSRLAQPVSQLQDERNFPVRGEINQTYQLSPDSLVEAIGIEGAVDVEVADTSQAEVHLRRFARTQRDYDCERINIQHTAAHLLIEHQTVHMPQCRIIQAHDRLKLVVPRTADLTFRRIEGPLTVGATDRMLRLESIEGYVRLAEVQAAEMRGLEQGLTLTVQRLSPQGIRIEGVENSVELKVAEGLNADLTFRSVEGGINAEVGGARFSNSDHTGSRMRLGTGGPGIRFEAIEGGITIRRA